MSILCCAKGAEGFGWGGGQAASGGSEALLGMQVERDLSSGESPPSLLTLLHFAKALFGLVAFMPCS